MKYRFIIYTLFFALIMSSCSHNDASNNFNDATITFSAKELHNIASGTDIDLIVSSVNNCFEICNNFFGGIIDKNVIESFEINYDDKIISDEFDCIYYPCEITIFGTSHEATYEDIRNYCLKYVTENCFDSLNKNSKQHWIDRNGQLMCGNEEFGTAGYIVSYIDSIDISEIATVHCVVESNDYYGLDNIDFDIRATKINDNWYVNDCTDWFHFIYYYNCEYNFV